MLECFIFNLSYKKLTLDIKAIPNILIADFGNMTKNNPILTLAQQKGLCNYDLPLVNMSFSLLLRYQIQEAKRSRRKETLKYLRIKS